ncbi:hypothetical protein N657DRAFT_149977 [Parathielavia appendiculata]|uniref:Uncharacterized protein n=1 Tax=Parathielavia appendiculata TaxID=2587402 RepID=A0AAN6TUT5_9PEZI|nr:hypothetical protein N657DRAFT_149977 [Parathielavia appendiculata]
MASSHISQSHRSSPLRKSISLYIVRVSSAPTRPKRHPSIHHQRGRPSHPPKLRSSTHKSDRRDSNHGHRRQLEQFCSGPGHDNSVPGPDVGSRRVRITSEELSQFEHELRSLMPSTGVPAADDIMKLWINQFKEFRHENYGIDFDNR